MINGNNRIQGSYLPPLQDCLKLGLLGGAAVLGVYFLARYLFPPKPPGEETKLDPNRLRTITPMQNINPEREYKVVGIANRGNTCFINTALQIIMNTPALRDTIVETHTAYLKEKGAGGDLEELEASKTFLDAVKEYQQGNVTVDLNKLRVLTRDAAEPKSMGDAKELIDSLLARASQKTHPELFFSTNQARLYKKGRRLHEAELVALNADPQSKANCPSLADNRVSIRSELMTCLTVPVPERTTPFKGQKLLDRVFTRRAIAEKDADPSICSRKGRYHYYRAAVEQFSIENPPEGFMIQLARFTSKNGRAHKIDTTVAMPETITLPLEDGTRENYRLTSIGVHSGNHYYACLYDEKTGWHIANDSKVTKASNADLIEGLNRGYIYMYKKAESS